MARYTLTLSGEQLDAVKQACELYARVRLGQFDYLRDMLLDYKDKYFMERRALADSGFETAQRALFGVMYYSGKDNNGEPMMKFAPPLHVKHDKLSERAYDAYQVIRYTLAKEHDADADYMSRIIPMSLIHEELPVCEKVNEDAQLG